MLINYSTKELDLCARLMRAEALSEGDLGMLMVGNVIVNRAIADCLDFKNIRTITDVIYQNNQVLLRYVNESDENNITAFREVNESSKEGKAKEKTTVSFISIETVGFHLFQGYSLEGYTGTDKNGKPVFYFATEQDGEPCYWMRYIGTKGCYPVTKYTIEEEIKSYILD